VIDKQPVREASESLTTKVNNSFFFNVLQLPLVTPPGSVLILVAGLRHSAGEILQYPIQKTEVFVDEHSSAS
jgi:hypothetical protein